MAFPGGSHASQPGRGAGHRHPRADRARARAAAGGALRSALYGYAFNPARAAAADEATARVLAWTEKASLRVTQLADPLVLRQALDALTLRLDGRRAAANTITRKRAVFHGALGYAVEAGLLESNPADRISWRPPKPPLRSTPRSWPVPRRCRPCWRRWPGSARSGGVLRLPVLHGPAPGGSHRPAQL